MLEFDSIALLWSCVYVAFEIGVILASVQQAEICVYCLSVGMLLLGFLYTVMHAKSNVVYVFEYRQS
jgi:uncharacterized membrane protein